VDNALRPWFEHCPRRFLASAHKAATVLKENKLFVQISSAPDPLPIMVLHRITRSLFSFSPPALANSDGTLLCAYVMNQLSIIFGPHNSQANQCELVVLWLWRTGAGPNFKEQVCWSLPCEPHLKNPVVLHCNHPFSTSALWHHTSSPNWRSTLPSHLYFTCHHSYSLIFLPNHQQPTLIYLQNKKNLPFLPSSPFSLIAFSSAHTKFRAPRLLKPGSCLLPISLRCG